MIAPVIRGWCPGALRPMMSGDGLVVRVRAPLGRLSPKQATGIADLARRFGNGYLDLTTRANLQIRGVTEDRHAALVDGLAELGLIDPGPLTEARRNILLSPFWTDGDKAARIAQALNIALTDARAPQTPGKFGYAVDCGVPPLLRNISADIRIETYAGGLTCRADGATTGAKVTVDTAAETALELARWFLDTGDAPKGRGRMARHLANGAVLPEKFTKCRVPTTPAATQAPGPTPSGQLVAVEFGQMTGDMLAHLATIAPLRLTPWRMVLLEGAKSAPDMSGFIHDTADPRLRINVCTGAPGCPQALSLTRNLARDLAPLLGPNDHLHISGCAKGCAHPKAANTVLTAIGPDRFDLIRHGRAGDTPDQRALAPTDIKKALLNAP